MAVRDYEKAIDKVRFMSRVWAKAAKLAPVGLERSTVLTRAAYYNEVADFLAAGVGAEERAARRAKAKKKRR